MYDLIVIGSGPGGYPAVSRAVKAGMKTLLIESGELGGTCLNRGCIPTKSFCRTADLLLDLKHAANLGVELPNVTPKIDMERVVERKNEIVMQLRDAVGMSIQGADVCLGKARFTGPDEVEAAGERYTTKAIIVATGSTAATLPIPGADLCDTSDTLLNISDVPASMAIIGGGVIGMEFASIFNAMGCEVTVIEYCKEILPGFDSDIAKRLRTILKGRGVKFITSAAATAVKESAEEEGQLTVEYTSKGKEGSVTARRVLMAVGRKPVVPEGLAEAGADLTFKGAIKVDTSLRTTIPGVYAIGDCNGLCQLAHAATAQATTLVDSLINNSFVDYEDKIVPAAVFTVPEVAMAGLTEEQAEEHGLNFTVKKIPVRANGKALALDEPEGMVKAIISDDFHLIGFHILGPHASDLIMEVALAMNAQLPVSAILSAIHPHPTLSELIPALLDS